MRGWPGFGSRPRKRPYVTGRFLGQLDAIVARHGDGPIKALKIDTEGHETSVTRGAERLLSRGMVEFVVCELNIPGLCREGSSPAALRALFRAHGYDTFLLEHGGNMPLFVPPGAEIVQDVIPSPGEANSPGLGIGGDCRRAARAAEPSGRMAAPAIEAGDRFRSPGFGITCNILFAQADRLAAYWPHVRNVPASIHIADPPR